MALNLEESIAITQNFASSVTLPNVLSFLKTRKEELVSGLPLEQRFHMDHTFRLFDGCNVQSSTLRRVYSCFAQDMPRGTNRRHRAGTWTEAVTSLSTIV